jgi:hypothetical protein
MTYKYILSVVLEREIKGGFFREGSERLQRESRREMRASTLPLDSRDQEGLAPLHNSPLSAEKALLREGALES